MTRQAKCVVVGFMLIAVALLVSTQVLSQEKTDTPPPGEQGMEEMMAKWAAMNAKGPEHKKFEQMVGTWDAEMKWWMAPGAEPMVSPATAEFELIFDGRYVKQTYTCQWMGKPFTGMSIEGYDNFKKKYVSIWLDSDSTGISMSLGTADESGKVTTYYGKMDDPMTGQKDKVVKSIAREINENKVVYEMYDTPPGGAEYKNMEIIYTRRK